MDKARQLKTLLSLVIIALGVLILVMLGEHFRANPAKTLNSDPECDISQNVCSAQNGTRNVQLAIVTRPVASMVPLTFEVTLTDIQADQVIIDLQGVEMYMGLHRVELTPSDDGQHWRGTLTLALCTSGEMRWQAVVQARQGQKETLASFAFSAR